jgi:chemotaxis protein MotB
MTKTVIKIKTIEEGIDGAPPWITTFVDMVSLLVTFFILLFTFASMDTADSFTYPKSIIGLSGTWSDDSSRDMEAPDDDVMASLDLNRGARVPHARPLDELAENVEEMGQKLDDEHQEVDLNRVRDGLRIRFNDDAGFRPGSEKVSASLQKSLVEATDVLQHYPHLVVVEGFTDDAFRPTSRYPEPEDLALARAEAAARVLTDNGRVPASRLLVVGIGNRRRPGATQDTAVDRSKNRRIEIVIQAISETMSKRLEAQTR